MKRIPLLSLILLAPACAVPSFETVSEITELCAAGSLQTISFDVFIDERDGCSWGEEGNVEEDQGAYTAREADIRSIEGMENTVVCSLDFDFNGDFTYEDDFFLTWNDAILLSNRGLVIEEFSEWMRYPLFAWDDIVELEIPTSQSFTPFCAGEDEGNASCEVPRKRNNGNWEGDLEYDVDLIVVHELAFRAQSLGGLDIGLVTTGDNDEEDCSHSELDLEVTGTGVVF